MVSAAGDVLEVQALEVADAGDGQSAERPEFAEVVDAVNSAGLHLVAGQRVEGAAEVAGGKRGVLDERVVRPRQ